jgi:hypothetical protein
MADVSTHSTLPTNLVSYWELEEASGTRVDSHGSNDLTDTNTVGQATGIQGNSADFESTNSERLEIADASQTGLDISPDISISMWIKPESLPSSGAGYSLCGKYRGAGGARQYVLSYDNSAGTYRFTWRTSSDGTAVNTDTIDYTMTAGTWYHVALIHDSGTATLYINGSSQGTFTGYATTIVNGSEEFALGYCEDVAGYYDGLMDEVGIWSKALTSGEVTDLYNSGAGLPYLEGSPPTVNSNFFAFF